MGDQHSGNKIEEYNNDEDGGGSDLTLSTISVTSSSSQNPGLSVNSHPAATSWKTPASSQKNMEPFFLRPELWAKIIGVFELIFAAVSSIFFGYFLHKFVSGGEESVIEARETNYAVKQYYQLGYEFLISVLAILLAISLLGFVMAIVLLKGSFKRDYKKQFYWIVYCLFAIGVIFLILLTYGGHVWSVILRSFIFVSIRGLWVWCVYVDMKDIEAEITTEDKVGLNKRTSNVNTTAI